MDKATKAFRRNSVRLKSISTGHADLNLVVSELKDVKSTAKAFIAAQNTAAHDLLRWSQINEMKPIQDTFVQFYELNIIWTDIQKEFIGHFKKFIHQFEMILEGEQHVDQVRNTVTVCERRESKIRKDIKNAARKSNSEDVRQLEMKLAQAERSKELAKMEVVDRVKENEAIKLIRVKESLLKLSESYLDLSSKCQIIYKANKDIAGLLPDVHNKNIHEIPHTDVSRAEQLVANAKQNVRESRRLSQEMSPSAPPFLDPPPPYSPTGRRNSMRSTAISRHSLQLPSQPSMNHESTSRRHSASQSHSQPRNPFDEEDED